MGMDYYIIPDEQTDCEDNFPESLSFFFEQVGGCGEYAEVEQVSRILQLDLSVFQELSYEDDDDMPAELNWHDIDTFADLIDDFIARIKRQPEYYTQVLHNPNHYSELNDLQQSVLASTNSADYQKQLEEMQKRPLHKYPPDRGYLSEGLLGADLEVLQQTLQCYKSRGVAKIRLMYM
jgi:hypothetical protein